MSAREQAWDAVWEALPARWAIGPPTYAPGRYSWHVTARGPHPGRGKAPVTVSGTGEDDTAALRDLDDRLCSEERDGESVGANPHTIWSWWRAVEGRQIAVVGHTRCFRAQSATGCYVKSHGLIDVT
jgi:hypothetical protein